MTDPLLLRRRLASASKGSLTCIDALRWATPLGQGLRLYLGGGVRPEDVSAGAGFQLTSMAQAGGALIVTGSMRHASEAVPLLIGGQPWDLATSDAETELFDDLNVILAQRFNETSEHAADWLAYHVTRQNTQAALLVNRAQPGAESDTFTDGLFQLAQRISGLKCLLVLDAPVPLGRPDQPATGDPATAPRPSSRAATPDPWRAPLAEPVLYDALKWRFLNRAGAVLALDLCDLMDSPEGEADVFEASRQSQNGLVHVTGEAIFAWRMKKGRTPGFGDHICRASPKIGAPQRWCVAPKRTGPETLWLTRRIVGLTTVADETASYTRAASVLFPTSKPAELVDKALLSEDAHLLRRATEVFGHDPVRPPEQPKVTAAAHDAAPTGRTVIVTCMKNEGPFILEWLAYHRMIGVDDFLVYTNDCDDGTDTMLDLLQDRGLLQRRDNPFRDTGSKPQQAALDAAQAEPLVQTAGWIISMDVDEFLNIHAGECHLSDLYAAIPGASAISVTWRLFGNSDRDLYEDRFILDQFTRCAPHLIRRPHQAWGFKTLFRNNGLFTSFGVHRPKGFQGQTALWVNGSGQSMPPSIFKTGWRSGIDTYGYDLVTLNHYATRNVESFLVKRDRGRVNHVARDQGPAYWFRMNNNDEEDRSIQRHLPALQREVHSLMADPAIAAAHSNSVAAHRKRISELRSLPEFAELYEQLTGDRMKKLSRMHRHFGMNVFLHGPTVVPDRLLQGDLPANAFFNVEPPEGRAAD